MSSRNLLFRATLLVLGLVLEACGGSGAAATSDAGAKDASGAVDASGADGATRLPAWVLERQGDGRPVRSIIAPAETPGVAVGGDALILVRDATGHWKTPA